uniref:Uncharacterized protein n=1 Tax=Rhizophora mucronata TaxID=61149 RepID=A0A2P2R591_RHIMU
MMLQFLSIHKA